MRQERCLPLARIGSRALAQTREYSLVPPGWTLHSPPYTLFCPFLTASHPHSQTHSLPPSRPPHAFANPIANTTPSHTHTHPSQTSSHTPKAGCHNEGLVPELRLATIVHASIKGVGWSLSWFISPLNSGGSTFLMKRARAGDQSITEPTAGSAANELNKFRISSVVADEACGCRW